MNEPDDVKEVAIAVAKTAEFGTQSVKTSERILGFLARMFKEPANDAMGIIGDKLKFLRWERQLRYVEKVNEILDERKVTETRLLPPKFALPIITNASLEEENDLQDLWARLTANAMDPSVKLELRYAFIDIIKSLNPLDVKILTFFFSQICRVPSINSKNVADYSLQKKEVIGLMEVDPDEFEISIENLFRVRCLAPAVLKTNAMKIGKVVPYFFKEDGICITSLGLSFVKACIDSK